MLQRWSSMVLAKLEGYKDPLKCSNCGQGGHNMKTCQRHLPSKGKKTAAAIDKKRRLNTNGGESSQNMSKKGKKAPMTANELRQKAKEKVEYQRKKMANLRAARLDANKPARGRPPKSSTTSTGPRLVQATSLPASVQGMYNLPGHQETRLQHQQGLHKGSRTIQASS
ncbi:uncharacterized protein LOC133716114 [Rosa rugosa]|uniref:uncharacterized protein LOC133716114 n=1 Tax=Rosa rugosa TaxID=74645 RepID=UPI002B4051B5|nr:uncharacterized protein LOC133716114 [Rosa rugosa]